MVKLSYYSNLGIQDFSKMGLVWNLFSNFGKQTKEEIIQQSRNGAVDRFSFTDKLIEKASSGGINLQQEEFNLGGFDFAHRNFKKLSDFKRLEKEVYLVNEIDKGSDEFQDGYGEYSENRIVEESNDFELVEENLDYTLAWGRFPDLSKKLEKQGYSLLYLLISFIDGSKPARENLSKVCDSDEDVREWVESIFIPDKLPDIRKRLEEFRRLGIFV
jgi:hypothetical protein